MSRISGREPGLSTGITGREPRLGGERARTTPEEQVQVWAAGLVRRYAQQLDAEFLPALVSISPELIDPYEVITDEWPPYEDDDDREEEERDPGD
jgi:hypothetical protein